MRKIALSLAWLALAAGVVPAAAAPNGIIGAERFFRTDWQVGTSRKGTPTISGYVYNDQGSIAINVRLLIEGLDASGKPGPWTIAYVVGTVPNNGRAYFETPAPTPAASYRVTVLWFEWIKGGGS